MPEVPPDRGAALRAAVLEVEAHVSAMGWDAPAHLFALVPTRELAAAEPELAAELGVLDGGAQTFTAVEQEIDVQTQAVERLLAQIGWPDEVAGAVVVVERLVLPPDAEADVPEDPEAAVTFAAAHAQRQDVRIAAGVLRTGESHCVVRLRSSDAGLDADATADGALLQGGDLVPALVAAVRETLEPEHRSADDGRPRIPRGEW